MKRIIIFLASVLLICNVFAQEKQVTIADAAYQNYAVFPKRLFNLQWMNDKTFVYSEKNALMTGTVNSEKRDTLLNLSDFSDFVVSEGGTEVPYFSQFEFVNATTFTFFWDNVLYQYDVVDKKGVKLNTAPKNAKNIDIDAIDSKIAYTKGNDLYVFANGQELAITSDGTNGVVNGKVVHRNEFGIVKGTFWSPKGNKLAFYRMDQSMVAEYPLVDISTRMATPQPDRYPMAGEKSHHVKVGVYDFATGKTVFLNVSGDPEQYLTNITWDKQGDNIFVAVLNRDQNEMKLNQFDANTGDFVATLFTEKDERYVEPQTKMTFLPHTTSNFIWQSQRSGHNHLYLYDVSGKLIREITKGNWDVTELLGFDAKAKKVFFQATKESPLQRHIYSCDLKSGEISKLSIEHGTHSAIFNNAGTYFIDIFSSTDVAMCSKIINVSKKTPKETQTLLQSPNPFQDYTLGEMTIDKIKSDNGIDLYYRLIKPVGFDPSKKYPTIVYVYGGPHAQLVTDSWLGGNDLFLFYLASQGYVVFTIDNQGSAGRGHDFESIIHRNLGQQECRDQMAGINFLKQFPWVDQERIGIDGWSYGGFMTINMLLTYPNVFKAGCAGGPVCDWKYYEVMYGERYMDKPEQNPEGYKAANLVDRAKDLEDKLMIIHGTVDNVVVWQQSLAFIQECISNGIQVDYFVYPGHEHNVRGVDRMHLYQKISDYFDLHLKGIIR